ncbi:hypothetical protein BDF19DRAFT_419028 [Syncephalis fuscata]|nr:hypothetical protein BDF19DRAFT_419028 [Syncephalis fuscata]
MKLSIAVVCTIVVAFVANTAMVDAKPNRIRRAVEPLAKRAPNTASSDLGMALKLIGALNHDISSAIKHKPVGAVKRDIISAANIIAKLKLVVGSALKHHHSEVVSALKHSK